MIYIYSYSLVERHLNYQLLDCTNWCTFVWQFYLSVKLLFLMNKCSVIQMLGYMLVLCVQMCVDSYATVHL